MYRMIITSQENTMTPVYTDFKETAQQYARQACIYTQRDDC